MHVLTVSDKSKEALVLNRLVDAHQACVHGHGCADSQMARMGRLHGARAAARPLGGCMAHGRMHRACAGQTAHRHATQPLGRPHGPWAAALHMGDRMVHGQPRGAWANAWRMYDETPPSHACLHGPCCPHVHAADRVDGPGAGAERRARPGVQTPHAPGVRFLRYPVRQSQQHHQDNDAVGPQPVGPV
eukprot:264945-Chlamydomonas_euryale.AAC.2